MKLVHWMLCGCCLTVLGCSSLIVRETDSTAEITGKVVARGILVLPTLFISEIGIAQAKQEEQRAVEQQHYQDWFHTLSHDDQQRELDRRAYQRAAALQGLGFGLMSGGMRFQSTAPRHHPPTAPIVCSSMPAGAGVTTLCR